MYPIFRLIKERLKFRNKPLRLFDTHVSHHMCLPWDLDPWMELNNGRTLTLFDLGRFPMMLRMGIIAAILRQGWGMTVAGNTARYRRRIHMFHRVEMRSRLAGWDGRFFYVEQSMWRDGVALNHILVRTAVTSDKGIVAPDQVIAAMGHAEVTSPPLPAWIESWIAADAQRPWPPQGD